MSKSNAFETAMLQHFFQNADILTIGDAGGVLGSVADGSLYVSLHTADPGEAGTQATSEATYTGYARVAVARSAVGWTVSGNSASNAGAVSFVACSGGTNTITHFGVGAETSGAGVLLYSGVLTSPLSVSAGITPQFAIGGLTVSED